MSERFHAYMFSSQPEPPEEGWLPDLDAKLRHYGGRRVSEWSLESVDSGVPGIPDAYVPMGTYSFLYSCDAERVGA